MKILHKEIENCDKCLFQRVNLTDGVKNCIYAQRTILNIYEDFPDFCPLEDGEEHNIITPEWEEDMSTFNRIIERIKNEPMQILPVDVKEKFDIEEWRKDSGLCTSDHFYLGAEDLYNHLIEIGVINEQA